MALWPTKRRKKGKCFSVRFIFYFATALIAVYCLAELLFNIDREYTCNKKNNVLLTIITATHNPNCTLLYETSQSIAKLTISPKWIIVNDHSSKPFCENLAFPHTLIKNVKQKGLGPARQVGIDTTNSEYFILLDDDDLLSATSVEKALWVLEHETYFSICGWFAKEFGVRHNQWRAGHFDGSRNVKENRLVYSQVVRTRPVRDCGASFRWMPNGMEDWDFWLQLARCGLFGHTIPSSEFFYRTRSDAVRKKLWPGLYDHYYEEVDKLKKRYKGLEASYPVAKYKGFSKKDEIIVHPGRIKCDYAKHEEENIDKNDCSVLLFTAYMNNLPPSIFALKLVTEISNKEKCRVTVLLDTYDFPFSESTKSSWDNVVTEIFVLPTFVSSRTLFGFLRHIMDTRKVTNVVIIDSFLGYYMSKHIKVLYQNVLISSCVTSAQYKNVVASNYNTLDQIFVSTHHLKGVLAKDGVPLKKLKIFYEGIKTWSDKQILRRKQEANGFFQDANGLFRIMFVGHFSVEVNPINVIMIIEEFYKQVKSHEHANIAVEIFGSGPLSYKVKKYLEVCSVDEIVTLHGHVKATDEAVCAASLLILPTSASETIPLVAMQAMACGVPVLGPDDGGFASIIKDKETGFLCPHKGFNCFVSYLLKLSMQPSFTKLVGRQALSMIRANFDQRYTMADVAKRLLKRKEKVEKLETGILDKSLLKAELLNNVFAWGDDGSTRAFFGVSNLLQRMSSDGNILISSANMEEKKNSVSDPSNALASFRL